MNPWLLVVIGICFVLFGAFWIAINDSLDEMDEAENRLDYPLDKDNDPL